MDVAVVDRDDVAGIVPAAGRRYFDAGCIGEDVSGHDIGTADLKAAAFCNAFNRQEARLNARKQAADTAMLLLIGQITGNHG